MAVIALVLIVILNYNTLFNTEQKYDPSDYPSEVISSVK